jgi:type 1 glutamine amidotransferase
MNPIQVFALIETEYCEHLQSLLQSPTIKRDFQVEISHDIEELTRLSRDRYSILVIYVNIKCIRDDLYEKLDGFVRTGGGLLSLHSTTASFTNQPTFKEMVGARFIRHGPIRKFLVRPAHSISKEFFGISEFFVEDELYRQEYTETAIAQFEYQGRQLTEPLVWTNQYGEGRSVGISPGHRIETMKNPNVVTIMEQSLAWLMRDENQHRDYHMER